MPMKKALAPCKYKRQRPCKQALCGTTLIDANLSRAPSRASYKALHANGCNRRCLAGVSPFGRLLREDFTNGGSYCLAAAGSSLKNARSVCYFVPIFAFIMHLLCDKLYSRKLEKSIHTFFKMLQV
jgi:hypothetical protein